MKLTLYCDIECYENYFLLAFQDRASKRLLTFELSERTGPLDEERIRTILRNNLIVTFNGLSYDAPMIYLALNGASNSQLKAASNKIIMGGLKWWEVGRELGVFIPPDLDHIDLIEPNPAVMQGLKVLNGRLHGPRMEDLPYPHDAILTQTDTMLAQAEVAAEPKPKPKAEPEPARYVPDPPPPALEPKAEPKPAPKAAPKPKPVPRPAQPAPRPTPDRAAGRGTLPSVLD